MPITIRCHACDTRVSAPDAAAGRRVKCPRCGEELSVPQQAGAVPGWMAAPPPVRRPAPAPAATATSGSADPPPPDADAAPQPPPEPIRYDEPEPWYYRFIERVVIGSMWFGLALRPLLCGFDAFSFSSAASGSPAGLPASSAAAGGCVMLILGLSGDHALFCRCRHSLPRLVAAVGAGCGPQPPAHPNEAARRLTPRNAAASRRSRGRGLSDARRAVVFLRPRRLAVGDRGARV